VSDALSGLAEQLRTGTRPAAPEPLHPQPQRAAASLVGPLVELDAGPFHELADVILFEHALRELPNVTDVYLRQFEQERAQVELSVAQPVRLVEDIAARLPFAVDVTPGDSGRATLTVYPVAREA
jgi:hypothetical protein